MINSIENILNQSKLTLRETFDFTQLETYLANKGILRLNIGSNKLSLSVNQTYRNTIVGGKQVVYKVGVIRFVLSSKGVLGTLRLKGIVFDDIELLEFSVYETEFTLK